MNTLQGYEQTIAFHAISSQLHRHYNCCRHTNESCPGSKAFPKDHNGRKTASLDIHTHAHTPCGVLSARASERRRCRKHPSRKHGTPGWHASHKSCLNFQASGARILMLKQSHRQRASSSPLNLGVCCQNFTI